jgi:hypothetical protein
VTALAGLGRRTAMILFTSPPHLNKTMKLAGPLFLLLASCSEATPVAVEPIRPLPAYSGAVVGLFDDGIEPEPPIAGFEPGASPTDSLILRERTELGDWVARVRVVTITSTRSDAGVSWQIALHTLETLAGERPAEADWTLRVSDDGAAAGVLRSLEGRLVERTFIVFLREFAPSEAAGRRELHFHMAGEDQDQLGAVRVAALLAQVR